MSTNIIKANTPQSVTQEAVTPPKSYSYQTVIDGTVQMSLPNIGIMLVRPNANYNLGKFFACRPSLNATQRGNSNVSFPMPGTKVNFTIVPDTYKGSIISANPIGTEPKSYTAHNHLHNYRWEKPLQDCLFHKNLIQEIDKQTKRTESAAPCGALQDMYAGDTYMGDKNGGGIFLGRAVITVKGSDLAYTEYSAVSDKITTLASTVQTDTLSTFHTVSNTTDKYLKAGSSKEGLGMLNTAEQFPITAQGVNILAEPCVDSPLYRYQQFNGGTIQGRVISIHSFEDSQEITSSIVSSDISLYDGTRYKASSKTLRTVKTPVVAGLKYYKQTDKEKIQAKKQELSTVYQTTGLPEANNATERALQLEKAYTQQDTGILLSTLWDIQTAMNMLDDGIIPQVQSVVSSPGEGLSTEPQLQRPQETRSEITQQLPFPKYTSIQSTFNGSETKIADTTSFITQQADGSIIIKDGYGSSIIMSKGNIYLSSALDTFIRPGRDLIQIVPRRTEITGNQSVVVAAQKDISIAAGQNAKLSSGVSGDAGFTVLQNRSNEDNASSGGLIIRSNSNMSITASKDMRIALNDKTKTNAKDKATVGKGSIIIQGSQLALKTESIMNICAKGGLGLYAYSGKQGAGINIGMNYVDIVGSTLKFDTGAVDIGKSQTTHTVTPLGSQESFTLNAGTGTLGVHLKGQLYCRDIYSAGSIMASSQIVGRQYFILSQKKGQVYGMQQNSIDQIRKMLKKIGNYTYKAGGPINISITQPWYNDNYICINELSFTPSTQLGFSQDYRMPTMPWQLTPVQQSPLIFTPVTAYSTGDKTETVTYPGKQAWEGGHMSDVDNRYNIDYETKKILQSYTTNTKMENE